MPGDTLLGRLQIYWGNKWLRAMSIIQFMITMHCRLFFKGVSDLHCIDGKLGRIH